MKVQGKTRIAFIVNRLDVGGLERYVARMCQYLPRDRFSPEIICLARAGAGSDWIDRAHTPIHELDAKRGNDRNVIKRLNHLVKIQNYQIVQSHNWGTLIESYLGTSGIKSQTKHIHAERGTVLGPDCSTRLKRLTRSLAMRFMLRRVDGVVCNAHAIEDKIRRYCKLRRLSIEVIPNGLDLNESLENLRYERDTVRKQFGLGDDAFVVGYLGRLSPVKNPRLLVNAYQKFLTSVSEAEKEKIRLVIVGDGPLRDGLESHVDSLGIKRVVFFAGEQTNSTKWLSAMDLFVNSSLSEGMSQAVLESMALGVPAIVTDVGDSKLMVGGTGEDIPCGEWVRSDDVQEMASTMVKLFYDSATREVYSQRARDRFEAVYSLQSMLESYDRYYRGVLNGSLYRLRR
jgi:glycosyltransferase involved in cell wall biosynthesis